MKCFIIYTTPYYVHIAHMPTELVIKNDGLITMTVTFMPDKIMLESEVRLQKTGPRSGVSKKDGSR
jgi:hypothetical protein